MTVNAILACDKNWGIGYKNRLPWPRNDYDMKWFKENTYNGIVLMGRKTWESLDCKRLPHRVNCVVTHRIEDVEGMPDLVFNDSIGNIVTTLSKQYPEKKIWIIGGANLYTQAIPYCSNIYLTQFKTSYECDTFIDPSIFDNFRELAKVDKSTECDFSIWGRI